MSISSMSALAEGGVILNAEEAASRGRENSIGSDFSATPNLGAAAPTNTPQMCLTPSRSQRKSSALDSSGKPQVLEIPGNTPNTKLINEKLETLVVSERKARSNAGETSSTGDESDAVKTLRKMDEDVSEAVAGYEAERKALEDKWEAKMNGLYEKRSAVLYSSGLAADGAFAAALPGFWRQAMEHNALLREAIAEKDADALEYLVDIKTKFLPGSTEDEKGFRLDFKFHTPNPYFENALLSKTYNILNVYDSTVSEPVLKSIEGCEIKWKPGKDLTHKVVKQRKKNSTETRTVRKPTESFFNFFDAPTFEDVEDEEEYNDRCEIFDMDLEMAMVIRTKIVPRAIRYFTGEAKDSDDEDDDEEDGDYIPGEFSDEESSGEEDSDDEEDSDGEEGLGGPVGDGTQPKEGEDCKQQ